MKRTHIPLCLYTLVPLHGEDVIAAVVISDVDDSATKTGASKRIPVNDISNYQNDARTTAASLAFATHFFHSIIDA